MAARLSLERPTGVVAAGEVLARLGEQRCPDAGVDRPVAASSRAPALLWDSLERSNESSEFRAQASEGCTVACWVRFAASINCSTTAP